MLEAIRQNSRSAIIYILFAVIIVAFVISFGPGSTGGGTAGITGGLFAAKVAGDEISEKDFKFAYRALASNFPPAMAQQQRIKELIMDRLIERELLAQEAERSGLLTSEKEVNDMLTNGKMMVAGQMRRIDGYALRDGVLDYDRFRLVTQNVYGLTVKNFVEIQQRELLADKLRELTRISTKVSPDEVKADFQEKGRQANLEYVRFSARRFEDDLSPTDAEVEDWARAHEAEIKKAYDDRKYAYEKQDPSVRLRHIFIELPKDAPADKLAEAQGRMDVAQKTLKSGTRFADVARGASEDIVTRQKGGDMGWLKQGFSGLPEGLEKKIFAAKSGDLVGPERTDRGLELIKIEGARKGDIALSAARGELAEELYRGAKAKEQARAAAQEVAAKVKAGGKLAELYPKSNSDADEAKARVGKAQKVEVEETGLFSRRGDVVQGIGPSAELAKAAFTTLKVGETIGPLDASGSFIVATLKEKKEPDMADWEKRRVELIQEFQRTKWFEVITAYGKQRCTEAHAAGKITVNPEILTYEGGAGPANILGMAGKYEPCSGRLF